MGSNLNSLEAPLLDKPKGKELIIGMSKRSKKRVGEMSSTFLPSLGANVELWKPKFFICELSRQVTMADSAKDHDTSMALVRAIMLLKDVASLIEENSETIRGLVVM